MKLRLHTLLFFAGLLIAGSASAQTGLISFNFASFGSAALNFDGASHLSFSPDSIIGHDFQIASDSAGISSGLAGLYGDISDPILNNNPSKYTIGTISNNFGVETAPMSGGKGTLSIYDGLGNALTAKIWWVGALSVGSVSALNPNGTLNLSNFSYNGGNLSLQALADEASGTSVVSFQFSAPVSLAQLAGPTTHTTNFSGSFSAIPEPATSAALFGGAVLISVALRRRIGRQILGNTEEV